MSRQSGSINNDKINKTNNNNNNNSNNNNNESDEDKEYCTKDIFNNKSSIINFEPFSTGPYKYNIAKQHDRNTSLDTIESSNFSSDSEDDSNKKKKRKGKKTKSSKQPTKSSKPEEAQLKEVNSNTVEETKPVVKVNSRSAKIRTYADENQRIDNNNNNEDSKGNGDDNLNKEEKSGQKVHYSKERQDKEPEEKTRGINPSIAPVTPETKSDNNNNNEDSQDNDDDNLNKKEKSGQEVYCSEEQQNIEPEEKTRGINPSIAPVTPETKSDNNNNNEDNNLNKEEKDGQEMHCSEEQQNKEPEEKIRGINPSIAHVTLETKSDNDNKDIKKHNRDAAIDVKRRPHSPLVYPRNNDNNDHYDDVDDGNNYYDDHNHHLKMPQSPPPVMSFGNIPSSKKKKSSSSSSGKKSKLSFCCFATLPITLAFGIFKKAKKRNSKKVDDLESGKKVKYDKNNNNNGGDVNFVNENKVKLNDGKRKRGCEIRNCCLIIFLIIIILLLLGNMAYLDVRFASIQPLPSANNITQVIYSSPSNSTSDPLIKQLDVRIKSVVCMTILSMLPPKQYPCDFCSNDAVVFNNVSSLCVLKSIWANSNNQTSLEQNSRWMNDSNYCQWSGVTCDADQNVIGLEIQFPNTPLTLLDSLGKLTSLQKLAITGDAKIPSGTIPPSLLQLGSLNSLKLASTGLNGPVPDTFDKMTSLKTLQLINNGKLDTQIPASIGSLSLSTLVISQQSLSGAIPDFIGQSKTLQTSLQVLDLSSNKLIGNIPNSLMQLNALKTLNLNNNQLSGNIPATLSQAKFQNTLTTLDLNSNAFQNKIPDSISAMGNLTFLYLQINKLNGSIPNSLAKLSKLSELILNGNQLTGNIPDILGSLPLTKLILSNNTLTGAVPTSVCQRQYTTCDLTLTNLTSPVKCTVCSLNAPVVPPVTTIAPPATTTAPPAATLTT